MLPQLISRSLSLVGTFLLAGLLTLCQTQTSVCAEDTSVDLAMRQSQIADRYRQLETMLLKMAEYDASSNPRRAALLRQALLQGKERQVNGKLNELVNLFQREQLQKAVDGQVKVGTDLKALLDLLLSEDRPDRLKNEQARVRGYIKQLDRIIRQEKSIQGRTEGGADLKRLADDQNKVADKTKQLTEEIDAAEGLPASDEGGEEKDGQEKDGQEKDGEGKDGEGKDGESKDGESKDGESKDGESKDGESKDGESKDGESKDGESKDGESKDGESKDGESKDGESKDGPPGEGQQGESQQGEGGGQAGDSQEQQAPQDQQFPGRKRIAAAEDRMRQAQKDLEETKREDAIEKQEEARRLLEMAKAELEEILRQLREEEIERVLAMLEGRFRRMLEMELKLQDGTVRLSKTPAAKRTRQFTVKAGKLSLDQRKVVLEVDKALTLLREEGSSVAFPEAAAQMRVDMDQVARRLSEEKVGELTQAIEADIVTSLEEMIAALQKAQQEAEERRKQQQQQQQQQQPGDPSNQPLVNKIAELKMIRALQMRVNTRTQRFAKMLSSVDDPVGQALDDDLSDSIRELSSRQKRIHKVTSDIILGKNQ